MKSNVDHWKQLQQDGYFDNHPCYTDREADLGENEVGLVNLHKPLDSTMSVAVIGSGFGRESVAFGKRVARVYGIDVSEKILATASKFVAEHDVNNFHPVLAERFANEVPEVDVVFSYTVMQHLTRDLVENYFRVFSAKLKPQGMFAVQFLETIDNSGTRDAELTDYEPSVTWTAPEIIALLDRNGLALKEMMTIRATKGALWHWVFAKHA